MAYVQYVSMCADRVMGSLKKGRKRKKRKGRGISVQMWESVCFRRQGT